MNRRRSIITHHWYPGRAALAGIVATLVYSIAMEGDTRLTGNHFNDIRFLEGLLVGEKREKRWTMVAWAIHFLNGVILAEIYAAGIKRFLPGPNWLKGAIFGETWIVGLWWLTPLADNYHPLIKQGQMPKLANWPSFLQNLARHLTYGLTLGLLYRDGP
jgi:hypothetical protein